MQIKIAKTAGFCFGVDRAVKKAFEAADNYDKVVTLGPIIHNPQIVSQLEEKGVTVVDLPQQVPQGTTVVIRSHGVGKWVYDYLDQNGISYVDATCPFVAKIHHLVSEHSGQGRRILVAGDASHPEVQGIVGFCQGPVKVFKSAQELEKITQEEPDWTKNPAIMVAQTTFNVQEWRKSSDFAKKVYTNLIIFDTICNATEMRQQEAIVLAKESDYMVVIGGKNSSNTRKLAEICQGYCETFHIERAEELPKFDLSTSFVIGVTAGASTPACIIKEVQETMSEFIIIEELSFGELLDQSFKSTYNGKKETGVVVGVTPTEVQVDIGTKHTGYVPLHELTDDPSAKIEDLVKVGDEIETYVMRVNDVEGTVMLSKKRLDSANAWNDIDKAREEKQTVEGIVIEENKGGVVVTVKGLRVFVPASQTGLPRDAAMTELLKKKVKLRITEVNQSRRRVVGSIKAVAFEERRAKADKIWEEIEENKEYTGTVKSLTSYGAFVDIGGVDGMVHVSELSWNRIRQPGDVLTVGDQIEVYVLSFDKEKKKISLGYKGKGENPWTVFTNTYKVDDVANVKIVKLMPFGAFAEIVAGVDGLIHISQIADRRIGKPEEVLSEGQMVDAKIIEINEEKQKVSLSIRALLAPAAEEVEEAPVEEDAE